MKPAVVVALFALAANVEAFAGVRNVPTAKLSAAFASEKSDECAGITESLTEDQVLKVTCSAFWSFLNRCSWTLQKAT